MFCSRTFDSARVLLFVVCDLVKKTTNYYLGTCFFINMCNDILYDWPFSKKLSLFYYSSMENLAKEINDNGQAGSVNTALIVNEGLSATIEGKRRVSTCSGYSTTTGG